VAQAPGESRDTTAPEGAGVATPSPAERRDPSLPNENGPAPERRTPSTERRLVAHERVPAAVTYDREISALRKLLEQRRNDLEPSTVAVLENSLTTIDKAIAEARAALAGDPASRFLKDQLNKALDKKLELLRTAALLPSRT